MLSLFTGMLRQGEDGDPPRPHPTLGHYRGKYPMAITRTYRDISIDGRFWSDFSEARFGMLSPGSPKDHPNKPVSSLVVFPFADPILSCSHFYLGDPWLFFWPPGANYGLFFPGRLFSAQVQTSALFQVGVFCWTPLHFCNFSTFSQKDYFCLFSGLVASCFSTLATSRCFILTSCSHT